MQKPAITKTPISSIIAQRWSPRVFSNKQVEPEKLDAVLEAARWTSSAFNEQPWRFIIGQNKDEAWQKIFNSLIEWNQQWAKTAPVLILNLAKLTFSHNDEVNDVSKYDLGQAVSAMVLEAVNQHLFSHQMTGFDGKKAEELFNVPKGYKAISVTAMGYYGNPEDIPEGIANMELNERSRKNLDEIAFGDLFGKPYK